MPRVPGPYHRSRGLKEHHTEASNDGATAIHPGVGESCHVQRVDTVEPKFLEGACRQLEIYRMAFAGNTGTGTWAPISAK